MVGLGHGHRLSLSSGSNKLARSDDDSSPDGPEDETTVVEPEQGNVLSHIISQLRPGADLSRVVLPTFILEPRSMLERITNFMQHPETLLPMPTVDDPIHRFVAVVKFYLSGWHIKPPGVKKPLNPILGEYYTCYWDYSDGTRGYYIAEQTSHHPPKSSYFYMAPEHHIRIDGTLKPRSKFLGNSAASLMEGIAVLTLLNKGNGGEKYVLTQPNMYARGILFGKMKYELGDHSVVRCSEHGLVADVEFKTKGYFGGTYNAIGGVIKNENTGQALYELSGMWTGEMFIKDLATGHRELLFDASKSQPTPPQVRPLEEQNERESLKLWFKAVAAIKERNHEAATDEKGRIEEMQRAEAAKRAESGVEWKPRFFRAVKGGPGGSEEGFENLDWILDAEIDGSSIEEQTKQILSIIPIVPDVDPERVRAGMGAGEQRHPPQIQQQQLQQPPQPSSQQNNTQPQQPAQDLRTAQRGHDGGGDLVDFGQNEASAADAPAVQQQRQQQAPPPQQQAQPQQQFPPQQQQQSIPPQAQAQAQAPVDGIPSKPGVQQLQDVTPPAGLQQPLQPGSHQQQGLPPQQVPPPQQAVPPQQVPELEPRPGTPPQASAPASEAPRPSIPKGTSIGGSSDMDVFVDASEDITKR